MELCLVVRAHGSESVKAGLNYSKVIRRQTADGART